MAIKKTFCEKCRNERGYITQSAHMVALKGREYPYPDMKAHCKVCNAPVMSQKLQTPAQKHFMMFSERKMALSLWAKFTQSQKSTARSVPSPSF